ncbi:MAG: hypothetical protein ACYCT0_10470 [Sulfobacillus sp.]
MTKPEVILALSGQWAYIPRRKRRGFTPDFGNQVIAATLIIMAGDPKGQR